MLKDYPEIELGEVAVPPIVCGDPVPPPPPPPPPPPTPRDPDGYRR